MSKICVHERILADRQQATHWTAERETVLPVNLSVTSTRERMAALRIFPVNYRRMLGTCPDGVELP